MNFLCISFFCYLVGVVIALCIAVITYFKWNYSHWKRKNLQFLTPTSWYGTLENPLHATMTMAEWFQQNYNDLKRMGVKHGGIYSFATPVYFPIDPDIIKQIMQNDFQHFVDRGMYYNEKVDPLSANLFTLNGQKWRSLRVKLTPIFTSGKMKMMFETLVACSNPLKNKVDELTEKKQDIDIKELVACYMTDVIGSCAFGLDCNSFKSPDSEFRKCGKGLFNLSMRDMILQMICAMIPSIGYLFKIRAFPKFVTDFFFKVVKDTVNYRETNNVKRNDVLQLLTEIKMHSDSNTGENDGTSLTIEEIAAQCLLFFAAGFETSSSTITFCLYELAKNQEIQQNIRDEINSVLSKHDGRITYDAMMELKYMTQVIEETMRMYPSVTQLVRKCVKDYSVPNTNVIIDKGTPVLISVFALHHDPDHYPNPKIFNPERFSEENKKGRHQFTYIPFGEGPRMCIGNRFGMMQMKVCLAVLLKNFLFTLNKNTPKTLTINPNKFVLDSKETIWLNSKPIEKAY